MEYKVILLRVLKKKKKESFNKNITIMSFL